MIFDKKDPPSMPVVAMADIAFLLLVFFMVTTALDQNKKLKIEVPQARNVAKISKEQVFALYVDQDGRMVHAGDFINLKECVQLYQDHARRYPAAVIQLTADKRTPYELINDLLTALRKESEIRVAFVAEEEKE